MVRRRLWIALALAAGVLLSLLGLGSAYAVVSAGSAESDSAAAESESVLASEDSANVDKLQVSVSSDKITLTVGKIESQGGTRKDAKIYMMDASNYYYADTSTGIISETFQSENLLRPGDAGCEEVGTVTLGSRSEQTIVIDRYDANGIDRLTKKYYVAYGDIIHLGPVYANSFESVYTASSTEATYGYGQSVPKGALGDTSENTLGNANRYQIDLSQLIVPYERVDFDESGERVTTALENNINYLDLTGSIWESIFGSSLPYPQNSYMTIYDEDYAMENGNLNLRMSSSYTYKGKTYYFNNSPASGDNVYGEYTCCNSTYDSRKYNFVYTLDQYVLEAMANGTEVEFDFIMSADGVLYQEPYQPNASTFALEAKSCLPYDLVYPGARERVTREIANGSTTTKTLAINTSNQNGAEYLEALIAFLCERYNKLGVSLTFGLSNEIDFCSAWNCMQDYENEERLSTEAYAEENYRSLRLMNVVAKNYCADNKVTFSTTHCWAETYPYEYNNDAYQSYTPLSLLTWIGEKSKIGGNFDWEYSLHSYGISLTESDIATFDTNYYGGLTRVETSPDVYEIRTGGYGITNNYKTSPFLTLTNLEILDDYFSQPENLVNGQMRKARITETGVNGNYGDDDSLAAQASLIGLFYAKCSMMDCISSFVLHRAYDIPSEGANFGLYYTPDGGANYYAKPSADVFEYIGVLYLTDDEVSEMGDTLTYKGRFDTSGIGSITKKAASIYETIEEGFDNIVLKNHTTGVSVPLKGSNMLEAIKAMSTAIGSDYDWDAKFSEVFGGTLAEDLVSTTEESKETHEVRKIALVGDSLVAGYDGVDLLKTIKEYAPGDYSDEIEMQNFGVGGAGFTVDSFISYELTEQYQASIDYEADLMVILMGSNDVSATSSFNSDLYTEGVEAYVSKVLEKNPDCKLVFVTSPTQVDQTTTINKLICSDLHPLQKQLCRNYNGILVDLNDSLRCVEYAESTDAYNALFVEDGVHLSDKGYRVVNGMLAEAIVDYMGATCESEVYHTGFDGNVWKNLDNLGIASYDDSGDADIDDTRDVYEYYAYHNAADKIDLSSNFVALMGGYLPQTRQTAYSGQKITSLSVYAAKAGELQIGKASLVDVIDAREDAITLTPTLVASQEVQKGYNTITLDAELADGETLVLYGTTALYAVDGLATDSDEGLYATINLDTHLNEILESDRDDNYSRLCVYTVSDENYVQNDQAKNDLNDYVASEVKGMKVSILSDSISTFAGYSNNASYNSTIAGNQATYPVTTMDGYEMDNVNQSYWMQSINHLEMTLCVNNSWGGSGMKAVDYVGLDDTSAGWNTRCVNLHNNAGEDPDIILVGLGVNDLFDDAMNGRSAGTFDDIKWDELIVFDTASQSYTYTRPETYAEAYAVALHKMMVRYPDALICPMGCFYNNILGSNTEDVMNSLIKELCDYFGMYYIDLYDCGLNGDNIFTNSKDGVHLNYRGMNYVSHSLEDAIINYYTRLYQTKDDVKKVVLLSGQSNASGFTQESALKENVSEEKYAEYSYGYDNVYIRYKNDGMCNVSPEFVNVQLGQGALSSYYGPEIGLAEYLSAQGEDYYIIKQARSGTSLDYQWLSDFDRGTYYEELLFWAKASMNQLKAKGINAEIVGFCWAQGEGDASDPEANPDHYFRNTSKLLEYLRSDLSSYIQSSGMVFVDAGISDLDVWTYYEKINKAKEDYSQTSDLNTFFSYIDNGLTSYPEGEGNTDYVHLDSLSQIKFGKLFAENLLVTLGKEPTPNPKVTQIAGDDRYATAAAIAKKAYPNGASGVIIATGTNFPDALGATSLAGMLDYPVLLTDANGLSAATAETLPWLGVKDIIIMGGTNAVSSAVEEQLRSYGTVTRIAGADRIQTSEDIYVQGSRLGSWGDTAIIATGWNYPDALSISGFAFSSKSPIFLCSSDGLSTTTQAYLNVAGFSRIVIVGGPNAVPTATEDWLKANITDNVVRLGGAGRYETSTLIAEFVLDNGGSANGACIATGSNFPDALAGGALVGRTNSILLLAEAGNTSSFSVLSDNSAVIDHICYLGGNAAVPLSVRDAAERAANL